MIPAINLKETGINLRRIMDKRGISAKDIQEYLNLASVQSVYNWCNGINMPTIDNLYVEKQLSNNNWNVDVVLSHTVPYDYRPVDLFLTMIDQSTVDETTELWLGEIEEKLDYKWWYAGHYHTSRVRDKVQIMFEEIEEFLHRKLDYQ